MRQDMVARCFICSIAKRSSWHTKPITKLNRTVLEVGNEVKMSHSAGMRSSPDKPARVRCVSTRQPWVSGISVQATCRAEEARVAKKTLEGRANSGNSQACTNHNNKGSVTRVSHFHPFNRAASASWMPGFMTSQSCWYSVVWSISLLLCFRTQVSKANPMWFLWARPRLA